MSSVNSFETDMRKLRRRRKNKRILKNMFLIFAIIVIALLVYVTRSSWISYFDGILERAQFGSNVHIEGEIAHGNYPIDISKKTKTDIGSMSKCWTLFADTTFYVYSDSGDIVYSVQASYSNPIINETAKRTLIYDLGGYNFMVLSNSKQVYSKQLTDQILLGAVGSDGTVAIVTSNDKYTSYLTVYDKNGSEIFHWADSNMITAVDINEKCTGCIVSSSYARGGEYKTVISAIDFSSTELAMKSSPIDALTFGLEYCQDDQFWIIADNALYRMSFDGTIGFKYDYKYDLVSFSANDKIAALVFESVGNEHTAVSLMGYNSNEVCEIIREEKINYILADGSTVYMNTDSALEALNRNGESLLNMELDGVYRQFSVSGNNIYLLGYKYINKIQTESVS